jgi:multicomponent Na+:H+ antiporter subunit B
MKNSIVLKVSAKILTMLMLVFSVFLLLRGHNEPGGGFLAGLIVVSALSLYVIAYGAAAARCLLKFDFRYYIAMGLACTVFSGLFGLLTNSPFLDSQWIHVPLLDIYVGSPLLFDFGVYLTVIGAMLKIIISIEESTEEER